MDTRQPSSSSDTPENVLERLEAEIAEAVRRLTEGGRIDTHHRASVAELRGRLATLRKRLAERAPPADVPAAVKSDFDLLAWDYKRWIANIDKEFENAPAHPQGLGRGTPA